MAIIKQKSAQQQKREGWLILAVGVVLAILAATGQLDDFVVGFLR